MPSRTLLLFCFTRDIIYKLFINSHARCHSCSTYVSVSPLARRRARMKLTEIKKTRSSLRSALIFRIEIIPLSRLYFRKNFSRRRCLVSIISASRHRISDGKTATRFALFVDLSLSLLFPARPSSSPFFTFSFAVRFRRARRYT